MGNSNALNRIERKLDTILEHEAQLMSATDDLNTKLQGISDEADTMKSAILALAAAQATGSATAIANAVDAAISTVSASVDTVKSHVDAARDALPAATAPAPTAPTAPAA